MNTFFSVSMVTNFGFVTLEAFKLISQSQRLLPILKPYIVHWKTHWGKNPNLIQKSTCSKSHHSRNSHFQNTFFTKFSLSNSHFSQISHFRSPFLTKKPAFLKSHFSQKSHFRSLFFTKITFSKSYFLKKITFQKPIFQKKIPLLLYQIHVNLWTKSVILPQCGKGSYGYIRMVF